MLSRKTKRKEEGSRRKDRPSSSQEDRTIAIVKEKQTNKHTMKEFWIGTHVNEFTISFGKGVGMAKWVKWNIRVEHEVVFLLLSLLWGLSEDVLYLDNYAMLLCFFKYWYVCVLHSIFFEIFVSEVRYFIHQIVVFEQSILRLLSLRNYRLVLARRLKATVLWAKPFDCEKLNKIDFELFSSRFRHLCISFF